MGYREKKTNNLNKYLNKFNINFIELSNLMKAITHTTYAYENKLKNNNQRLEFLGDSILGHIVSEYLYFNYPLSNEGDLSKMKNALVSKKSLAEAAMKIKLYSFICVGKGEEKINGSYKESILSDTFESLIAAIYLDLGYLTTRNFVCNILLPKLKYLIKEGMRDYKTILQELVQKKYKKNIKYKIIEELGPAHEKKFIIGVLWKNNLISVGFGKNKKDAESFAAKQAILYFSKKKTK